MIEVWNQRGLGQVCVKSWERGAGGGVRWGGGRLEVNGGGLVGYVKPPAHVLDSWSSLMKSYISQSPAAQRYQRHGGTVCHETFLYVSIIIDRHRRVLEGTRSLS